MGLDYEYCLFFPREEIWNVLQSVGKMSAADESRRIDVVLPDRKITLPFTSHFKSETIYYKDSMDNLQFDTSLYFESDEEIEAYIKEGEENFRSRGGEYANWTHPRDKDRLVRIGYIYLYIPLHSESGRNLIQFDFMSATTRMGVLFTKSQSIRRAFVRLLEAHHGVYGHIQDSDNLYEPILIYPPNRSLKEAYALLD
jgi:hypothetical protein